MAHTAQDTFVAEMPDGSSLLIHKGQVLPDNHPVVKRHASGGVLFQPMDFGDEDAPKQKRGPGRPRKNPVAAEDGSDDDGNGDG